MSSTALIVAVLAIIAGVQIVEGDSCKGKKFTCPETAITADFSNPSIRRPAQRDIIRKVYNISALPALTPQGQEYVKTILSHVDTDSPRLLNFLYSNAWSSLEFLHLSESTPPLCIYAAVINHTVYWHKSEDGHPLAESMRRAAPFGAVVCQMTSYVSLSQLKCHEAREPASLDGHCWRRGRAYQILEIIELYGAFLPCNLVEQAKALYSSPHYSDNLLAAMFTVSLTQVADSYLQITGMDKDIETLNFVLENRVSKCCCSKRAARLQELCKYHAETVPKYTEIIIDTVVLPPEC